MYGMDSQTIYKVRKTRGKNSFAIYFWSRSRNKYVYYTTYICKDPGEALRLEMNENGREIQIISQRLAKKMTTQGERPA